jgi:hypothetical protein
MLFDFVLCAARHLLHCYDFGSKGDENAVSLLTFTHKINVIASKLLLISFDYKVWRNCLLLLISLC